MENLFQSKSSSKLRVAGNFFAECCIMGIPPTEAQTAASKCKDTFHSWWRGKRFQKNDCNNSTSGCKRKRAPDNIAPVVSENEIDDENIEKKRRHDHLPLENRNSTRCNDIKRMILDLLQNNNNSSYDYTTDQKFIDAVDVLEKHYRGLNMDVRFDYGSILDGTWVNVTPPKYQESLGQTLYGDEMFTLGRMSFDMFSPKDLVCSIQKVYNEILPLEDDPLVYFPEGIPKSLKKALQKSEAKEKLRVYNIVVCFTIESDVTPRENAKQINIVQDHDSNEVNANENKEKDMKPKGLMTITGFILPDPFSSNRHSIWFTGGILEEDKDPGSPVSKSWSHFFGATVPEEKTLQHKAWALASNLLLGTVLPDEMDEVDGSLEFKLLRPIGGHGKQYIDHIYMDENMRIVRGHTGSIMVLTRDTNSS